MKKHNQILQINLEKKNIMISKKTLILNHKYEIDKIIAMANLKYQQSYIIKKKYFEKSNNAIVKF